MFQESEAVPKSIQMPRLLVPNPSGPMKNDLKTHWIKNRLKHLAKAYNERGEYVKKAISDMTDESDKDSDDDQSQVETNIVNTEKQEQNYIAAMFGDEWKPMVEISETRKQIL